MMPAWSSKGGKQPHLQRGVMIKTGDPGKVGCLNCSDFSDRKRRRQGHERTWLSVESGRGSCLVQDQSAGFQPVKELRRLCVRTQAHQERKIRLAVEIYYLLYLFLGRWLAHS